jgi:hypothetical protein
MIKYDDKEVEDIIKKHMSLIYATNIKDDRFKIFEYKTYLA